MGRAEMRFLEKNVENTIDRKQHYSTVVAGVTRAQSKAYRKRHMKLTRHIYGTGGIEKLCYLRNT